MLLLLSSLTSRIRAVDGDGTRPCAGTHGHAPHTRPCPGTHGHAPAHTAMSRHTWPCAGTQCAATQGHEPAWCYP